MLLSETFLKPSHRLNFPNYKTYRKDRLAQPGGGTAIIIKNTIQHHELPETGPLTLETNGIAVQTQKQIINIWSAYCTPNIVLDPNDIGNLFSGRQATILAGDLNAKHKDWNSKVNNSRAQRLKQMADQKNIIITGPEDPTHIHTPDNSTDVLDIALLKNIEIDYDITTVHDLSSDHLPVILNLGNGNTADEFMTQKTNWNYFRNLTTIKTPIINTVQDLEKAVTTLEEHLIDKYQKATTKTTSTRKPTAPTPDIQQLITQKRRAKKLYYQTLAPCHKTELNRITRELKQKLHEDTNKNWTNKLEKLSEDPTLADVWRITKSLRKNKSNTLSPLKTTTGTPQRT